MSARVVQDAAVRWISGAWEHPGMDASVSIPGPRILFLGIPFDHAVSHRPGTRFGPAAILNALDGFSLYCTDKRTDLGRLRLCRGGEIDVSNDIHATYRHIADTVAGLPGEDTPVFLGGDHSITDPILRGLLRRHSRRTLGLIVFDAHFDSRIPVPGKEHSGHWMHTVAEVFDHRHTVQLGIDAPIYSRDYMDGAEAAGIMVRTPWDIRRTGLQATVDAAIRHAVEPTGAVHVSIDIDCLSAGFAPGTSVPNAAGLMLWDVADALFEIARRAPQASLDIVEVSPPLDGSGITAQSAAHLVMNFLAGRAARLPPP
ncbi:agmatinase family protein [Azospirillum picis]|uniref:Agmatinase n=1 Tax=Azospirillum picis TaxID=488438 RepID=A0ABU0MLM2_9PROT|nr:agmatinase family protein [Azospirillum picis]MBP2301089.1 agmatinase [Azospirillum picis]MDQ0534291.1 agmatinase [Azospirillum picis]